jgi:hypothetical protein
VPPEDEHEHSTGGAGLGVPSGTSDRVLLVETDALAAVGPELDEADVAQHGSMKHALQA